MLSRRGVYTKVDHSNGIGLQTAVSRDPAGYPSQGPYHQESTVFLPTKAAMLFRTLQTVRPSHRLIMADFSSLPDVKIGGRLAPLVTSKVHFAAQQGAIKLLLCHSRGLH